MLKKVLFGFLMLTLTSQAQDINLKPEAKKALTKELQAVFKKYWQAYLNRDAKMMYNYEVPYFRYIYGYEYYNNMYVKSLRNTQAVTLKEISEEKGSHYIFNVNLQVEEKNVSMQDKWVKIDGRYYHVPDNFLVFPMAR